MSTSTSPISPIAFSEYQVRNMRDSYVSIGDHERARALECEFTGRKRIAPKCYYVLPAAALLGSVFTYSQLLLGHFGENKQSWELGKYAGMATAGVVGLSVVATLAETAFTGYEYGHREACGAFKRAWCWIKKPEGIMANTLSALLPITWCCWCRES